MSEHEASELPETDEAWRELLTDGEYAVFPGVAPSPTGQRTSLYSATVDFEPDA